MTLACLAAALCLAPVAMAQGPVCEGFDGKSKISRLGGRAAFAKPVTDMDSLRATFKEHKTEIESLMADRGLGGLSAGLFSAIASGDGVSEAEVSRGDVFEWMAFRRRTGATTAGPLCLASRRSYPAFAVDVVEPKIQMGKAVCRLSVEKSCDGKTLKVDATGSSSGVEVSMQGPGGTRTIISGGSMSWQGPWDDPYAGPVTFTAKATDPGKAMAIDHRFVVPKICSNLAYLGASAPRALTGAAAAAAADSCTETRTVQACVKPPPPKPTCSVELDQSNIRRGESVMVKASGRSDGIRLEVRDSEGQVIQQLDQFPATVTFDKNGVYTISGSSSLGGLSTPCPERKVYVGRRFWPDDGPGGTDSGWIFRPFALAASVDGDRLFRVQDRANGVNERSGLTPGGGFGLGLALEYVFNDVVGLEGALLYANLDADFMFDLDERWERDEDDVSFLALTFGPNFHLTPNSAVDFFIGPFIGFGFLGDASFRTLGENIRQDFDDDFLFGLRLGADIPVGNGPWAVHLGARYIDFSSDVSGSNLPPGSVDFDPFTVSVGAAYRF